MIVSAPEEDIWFYFILLNRLILLLFDCYLISIYLVLNSRLIFTDKEMEIENILEIKKSWATLSTKNIFVSRIVREEFFLKNKKKKDTLSI